MHALRKDILLYFDDNVEEDTRILLADGQYSQAYWQYLSHWFEQEWAESVHYQKLVKERGLVLLNGIALELLDQPITLGCEWPGGGVPHLLRYLHRYQLTSPRLATGKAHRLRTFPFLESLSLQDVDTDGLLTDFKPSLAGAWFNQEIVCAYLYRLGANSAR